jgi:hypothetical protein
MPNPNTQEELLQKSVTSDTAMSTNGGKLNRQQFKTIIGQTIDESTLLKNIKILYTDYPSGQFDKMNFGTHITKSATENTTYTETGSPTFSKVQFDTVKMISAVDISTEATEDSIEPTPESFVRKVTQQMSAAIANDYEFTAIEGDTSVGGSDTTSLCQKINDGFYKLSIDCPNILDANGLNVSRLLFVDALKKLPTKYTKSGALRNFKWIVGWKTYLKMQDIWSAVVTTGDKSTNLFTTPNVTPYGFQTLMVPALPEDLTIGTDSSNGTFIWFTDPMNFVYVIQRDMTMWQYFNIRKDTLELTVYSRTDSVIQDEDMMVKIRSIDTTDGTGYGA